MAEITSRGRRKFLAGSSVAVTAAATAQLGAAKAAPSTGRTGLAKGTATGGGSTVALEPPFHMVALNRLGFGPRRVTAGPDVAASDPQVIFSTDFETSSGNQSAGTDDVSYFLSLGSNDNERLTNYVDEQLDSSLPDQDLDQRMAQYAAEFPALNESLNTAFRTRECEGFSTYEQPLRQVERAAFNRAVYSRRQLYELMVDFWHNHFNVFAGDDSDTYAGWAHWDRRVIRPFVFGNFYNMLAASAKHPAMLHYLDNYVSTKGGFNENYARELFELHTMGAENYQGTDSPFDVAALAENPYAALNDPDLDLLGFDTIEIAERYVDNDVFEAARALTGWRYDSEDTGGQCGSGAFFTDSSAHDDVGKAILSRGSQRILAGGDAEFDGRVALKLAAYHPGTAVNIARKLCRRLISDNPPQSVVEKAAETFFANRRRQDQIARTIRTIVLSDEFKDPNYFNTKIKRPFEYVVSAMRAAGCDHTFRFNDDRTSSDFMNLYRGAGQQLHFFRTPDGYPDERDHWQGSTTLVQAWRTVDWLLDRNAGDDDRVMRVINITLENFGGSPTPRQLVEFWCGWIMGFTPPGRWAGGRNTGISGTELGQQGIRFMTQQLSTGSPDAAIWGIDLQIPRAELRENSSPEYWHERLRGLVGLILWSPQFMQR